VCVQALSLPWRGESGGVVGKALDGVRTVVDDVLRPSLAMALEPTLVLSWRHLADQAYKGAGVPGTERCINKSMIIIVMVIIIIIIIIISSSSSSSSSSSISSDILNSSSLPARGRHGAADAASLPGALRVAAHRAPAPHRRPRK
jgi:hypothetical protein